MRKILFVAIALMAVWGAEGKLAPPKIEDYTYVCQKCGKTTHYPKSYTEPRSTVEGLRDGCAKLRSFGLDITLDESVLCRHCVLADKLKIPRFATVLGNNVCIRLRPDLQDSASGHADRNMKMRILPKASGDPVDWVPVEWIEAWSTPCPSWCFENVEYGEGEDASLDRIFKHLEWTIKGKRRRADLFHLRLLLAYMRGQKEVQVGCLMSPIEEYQSRIDELISAPGETDVVAAARRQIGVTVGYDPAYRKIGYPGGDVPRESGVCTDVIIRALRDAHKIDLQQFVHEDMKSDFSSYPQMWGLKAPDSNIDHRRVPNLQCYFKRKGCALPVSKNAADYKPGDIVTVMVGGKLPHIMIVSDRKSAAGVPLAIHNIGSGTQEEDVLFAYPLTGHYRIP